jgi:hypothetical protein
MNLAGIRIKEKSLLARIAAFNLRSGKVAMVLGKTIHLHNVSKADFLKNERWLKHELCHIQQYRKYGFFPFLAKYLWESIRHGYYNNRFEVEAREAELM